MQPNAIEYWKVQNTGRSAGISWFDVGGNRYEPARFKSEKEARAYQAHARWDDASVKWRLVRITVERFQNKCVTTEELIYI